MKENESDYRYGTIADFNQKNFNKKYVFVLNHQNTKPTIEGRFFPNNYSQILVDDIFDPEKKRRRVIRYVPGEMSIYEDEQTIDKTKEPKNYFAEFSRYGDVVIDARETQKLEFFMKCNYNGSNPNRDPDKRPAFYMLDVGQGLKTVMEKDKVLDQAKMWCYTADWEDVRAYARAVGIDTRRDPDEVRWSLRIMAEKDAEKFLAGTKNDVLKRKNVVLDAIDRGLLTINQADKSVFWTNGGLIVRAPLGKDPIDFLVDSLFTPDGERVYATIRALIKPEEQRKETVVPEIPNQPTQATIEQLKMNDIVSTQPPQINQIENPDEFRDWVNRAKNQGVLVQNKAFFTSDFFKGKIMGYKGLDQFFKENPKVKAEMYEKVK